MCVHMTLCIQVNDILSPKDSWVTKTVIMNMLDQLKRMLS